MASKKECGMSLFDDSIVGGEITKFGAFPFMALLGTAVCLMIFS